MKYAVHVNAMVTDETVGFEAGIDITVRGGANVGTVGQAVQTALDIVKPDLKVPTSAEE